MNPTLARYSGICPLCSRYITKNRSTVVLLPRPLVPRGDGRISADDGGIYNARGQAISMHPRQWAHERCYPRFLEAPKFVELRDYDQPDCPLTYRYTPESVA